ncbi:MAG TPA: DUF1360 domain-containing protein [Solirubrobacteraceae bacterium]|nr:DUF1360 domain-containing protein [Solirubrobacteraceae bacterium]
MSQRRSTCKRLHRFYMSAAYACMVARGGQADMKPLSQTPTAPWNYGVLSAGYGVLLASAAWTAQRRRRDERPPSVSELAWGGLATFALAQALVHEKVEVWLRAPFLSESGRDQQDAEHEPKGSGLRYAVGELLSCTRCSGAWAALALTALHAASPTAAQTATRALALAGANDLLESGFTWARAQANAASAKTGSSQQQRRYTSS